MGLYKEIQVGKLIRLKAEENNLELSRICSFLKCSEKEIEKMYEAKSLDSEVLLRWSKLLEYDFFRIYSQHLILYAPPVRQKKDLVLQLPQFRKSIYTREVIDFILELITTQAMSKQQVIDEFRIPKTTLYKWINKYHR